MTSERAPTSGIYQPDGYGGQRTLFAALVGDFDGDSASDVLSRSGPGTDDLLPLGMHPVDSIWAW